MDGVSEMTLDEMKSNRMKCHAIDYNTIYDSQMGLVDRPNMILEGVFFIFSNILCLMIHHLGPKLTPF